MMKVVNNKYTIDQIKKLAPLWTTHYYVNNAGDIYFDSPRYSQWYRNGEHEDSFQSIGIMRWAIRL